MNIETKIIFQLTISLCMYTHKHGSKDNFQLTVSLCMNTHKHRNKDNLSISSFSMYTHEQKSSSTVTIKQIKNK